MPEKLLESVKNYFDITWEDPASDKKLAGMIDRAISYINNKGGDEFDYTKEGAPRTLMLNHIMYERSGILHEFYAAYQSEIIALQVETKVKRNAEIKG